jgi:hypothetical protein
MTEKTAQDTQSLSRQDFEKDVILRAAAEPAFRQKLLADPKAALQATYGVELPPDLEISVLEETPSKFYLVLPAQTRGLTDEELAAVAGGTTMPLGMKMDVLNIFSASRLFPK